MRCEVSPRAVRRMTGTGLVDVMRRQSSMPDIPGSMTSRTTRSTCCSLMIVHASSARPRGEGREVLGLEREGDDVAHRGFVLDDEGAPQVGVHASTLSSPAGKVTSIVVPCWAMVSTRIRPPWSSAMWDGDVEAEAGALADGCAAREPGEEARAFVLAHPTPLVADGDDDVAVGGEASDDDRVGRRGSSCRRALPTRLLTSCWMSCGSR